jgi:uroporphyrinogen decarboxylase
LLDGVRYGRHIFNLGHGVFPEADPKKLHWLTDYVHERSREIWTQER